MPFCLTGFVKRFVVYSLIALHVIHGLLPLTPACAADELRSTWHLSIEEREPSLMPSWASQLQGTTYYHHLRLDEEREGVKDTYFNRDLACNLTACAWDAEDLDETVQFSHAYNKFYLLFDDQRATFFNLTFDPIYPRFLLNDLLTPDAVNIQVITPKSSLTIGDPRRKQEEAANIRSYSFAVNATSKGLALEQPFGSLHTQGDISLIASKVLSTHTSLFSHGNIYLSSPYIGLSRGSNGYFRALGNIEIVSYPGIPGRYFNFSGPLQARGNITIINKEPGQGISTSWPIEAEGSINISSQGSLDTNGLSAHKDIHLTGQRIEVKKGLEAGGNCFIEATERGYFPNHTRNHVNINGNLEAKCGDLSIEAPVNIGGNFSSQGPRSVRLTGDTVIGGDFIVNSSHVNLESGTSIGGDCAINATSVTLPNLTTGGSLNLFLEGERFQNSEKWRWHIGRSLLLHAPLYKYSDVSPHIEVGSNADMTVESFTAKPGMKLTCGGTLTLNLSHFLNPGTLVAQGGLIFNGLYFTHGKYNDDNPSAELLVQGPFQTNATVSLNAPAHFGSLEVHGREFHIYEQGSVTVDGALTYRGLWHDVNGRPKKGSMKVEKTNVYAKGPIVIENADLLLEGTTEKPAKLISESGFDMICAGQEPYQSCHAELNSANLYAKDHLSIHLPLSDSRISLKGCKPISEFLYQPLCVERTVQSRQKPEKVRVESTCADIRSLNPVMQCSKQRQAVLMSGGPLFIQGRRISNYGGEIRTQQDLKIIAEYVSNEGGLIYAAGNTYIQANRYYNYYADPSYFPEFKDQKLSFPFNNNFGDGNEWMESKKQTLSKILVHHHYPSGKEKDTTVTYRDASLNYLERLDFEGKAPYYQVAHGMRWHLKKGHSYTKYGTIPPSPPTLTYSGRDWICECQSIENYASHLASGGALIQKRGGKTEHLSARGSSTFTNQGVNSYFYDEGAATISAGKTLQVDTKEITNSLQAVMTAPQSTYQFHSLNNGRGAKFSSPTAAPKPFVALHNLIDYIPPSPFHDDTVKGTHESVLAPIYPLPSTALTLATPMRVVITPQGYRPADPSVRFLYPPELEQEGLLQLFLSQLHRGYLDAAHPDLPSAYRALLANMAALAQEKNPHFYESTSASASALVPMATSTALATLSDTSYSRPLLAYYLQEYKGEPVYLPIVYLSSAYEVGSREARGHEGVLLGDRTHVLMHRAHPQDAHYQDALSRPGTVTFQGQRLDNTGTIAGSHLQGAIEAGTATKPQYSHYRRVEDVYQKRSFWRRKTVTEVRWLEELTSQVGGRYLGYEDISLSFKDLTCQGCEFLSEHGSISLGVRDQFRALPNVDTHITHSFSSGSSLLRSRKSWTHQLEPTIVPPTFASGTHLLAKSEDTLSAKATHFVGREDVTLWARILALDPFIITHEKGPEYDSEDGWTLSTTHRTIQQAEPTIVASEQGTIIAQGTEYISGQGTQFLAPQGSIKLEGGSITLQPAVLTHTTHRDTSGLVGFSYISQEEYSTQQEAICPVLAAPNGAVQALASTGNLTLIGPHIRSDRLLLEARLGSVAILPGLLAHSYEAQGEKIGLSFFGSEALTGLLQGDARQAAFGLARPFTGVFDALRTWGHSADTADQIGNSLHLLYEMYQTFNDLATHPGGFMGFVQGKINPSIGIQWNWFEQERHWTQAVLPWLMARHVQMLADKGQLLLEGVQGQGETLSLKAQDILIQAAKETASSSSSQEGVSMGVQIGGGSVGGINLGVHWSEADSIAERFLNAHLQYKEQVIFDSTGSLHLKGTVIETMKALIDAQVFTLESLQDIHESTANHGSFGATITPSGIFPSFSYGDEERSEAWVKEVSRISTHQLWAHIRKASHLLGSVLEADKGEFVTPVLIFTDTMDQRHAVASSVWLTDTLFSGRSAIYGLLDIDYRHDHAKQISRASISPTLHIESTSDLTHLNRDAAQAQALVKDKHTHVRLTWPLGDVLKAWEEIKAFGKTPTDTDPKTEAAFLEEAQKFFDKTGQEEEKEKAAAPSPQPQASKGPKSQEEKSKTSEPSLAEPASDPLLAYFEAVGETAPEMAQTGALALEALAWRLAMTNLPEAERWRILTDPTISRLIQETAFLQEEIASYLTTAEVQQNLAGEEGITSKKVGYLFEAFRDDQAPLPMGLFDPTLVGLNEAALIFEATQQRTLAQRSLDLLVRAQEIVARWGSEHPIGRTLISQLFEGVAPALEAGDYTAACLTGAMRGSMAGPWGSLGWCIACMLALKATGQLMGKTVGAAQEAATQWAASNAPAPDQANIYAEAVNNFISDATLFAGLGSKRKIPQKIKHGPEFPDLKEHAKNHGNLHPNAYYNRAIKHMETGKKFLVRHNGENKYVYLTRAGKDTKGNPLYQFTSTSLNGRVIFTHIEKVSFTYLANKGITLPKGF